MEGMEHPYVTEFHELCAQILYYAQVHVREDLLAIERKVRTKSPGPAPWIQPYIDDISANAQRADEIVDQDPAAGWNWLNASGSSIDLLFRGVQQWQPSYEGILTSEPDLTACIDALSGLLQQIRDFLDRPIPMELGQDAGRGQGPSSAESGAITS